MELNLGVLVAIVLGVVPGIPGETLYRLIAGSSWREDTWSRLLRTIAFSFAGFILYVLLIPVLGLPKPTHLSQGIASGKGLAESHLLPFAATSAGQFVGAALFGLGAGLIVQATSRWTSVTPYADGWDEFVREYVPGHWVILRLLDGSTYIGMLRRADISVPLAERDIVLEEPAEYVENLGCYRFLPYQYLFLPGGSLASVAILHDPVLDRRVGPVGSLLFGKDGQNEGDEGNQGRGSEGGSTSEVPQNTSILPGATPAPSGEERLKATV